MKNLIYSSLIENISYAVSSVLNENDITTLEKLMYEQDKRDDETWQEMANRVGFSDWYSSMGLKGKNIGEVYRLRRQRWLANACKDQKVIKQEIENLEDCIEFSFLSDDSYLESPNRIKELEQQIEELKQRISNLDVDPKSLDLKNANIKEAFYKCDIPEKAETIYDEGRVRVTMEMLCDLRDKLIELLHLMFPKRNDTEEIRRQRMYETGNADTPLKCRALILSYSEYDRKHEIINNINDRFKYNFKENDIYVINLAHGYWSGGGYTKTKTLPESIDKVKYYLRQINPMLEIKIFDRSKCEKGLYFVVIKLKQ